MVQVLVWLLAVGAILLGSASAEVNSTQHPGRYLGAGATDPSHDSLYAPIEWCGELLWVATYGGAVLVDPTNGGAIPHHAPTSALKEPLWNGLVACTKAGDTPILWFDTGEAIVWQSLDGTSRGEVRGFARSSPIWPYPLVAATDSLVVGVAVDGRKVEATNLPPGYNLISLPKAALDRFLRGSEFSFFEFVSPSLLQFYVHSDRYEHEDGTGGMIRVSDSLVIEVDPHRDTVLQRGIRVSTTIQERIHEMLEWPDLDEQGRLRFAFRSQEHAWACTLALPASGARQAVCKPLPDDHKSVERRLAGRFDAEDAELSPSGRWFVWDEWVPGKTDFGSVRFYVALTADLLKPGP